MSPSFSELREMSEEQFADTRRELADSSETTPPAVTDAHERFAASLSACPPVWIPVMRDRFGLYGWCSDGVQEKVQNDGGQILYGWTIWEWPGVLLTAEFHAVWRNECGDLYDITPKPSGETKILFVPDGRYGPEFNFDKRPRNRRVRLYREADRHAMAQALERKLSGAQRKYELRRADKAGLPLVEWLLRKVPADALARAIDDLIVACDRFDEHYDSLGTSGYIRPDETIRTLGIRRVRAQEHMKRHLENRRAANHGGQAPHDK